MNLNEKAKSITRPAIHFAYVEKIGPFMQTAQKAWHQLNKTLSALGKSNTITGKLSLFKTAPKETLQAGVSLATKPAKLPRGLKYARVPGGHYARFVLTGPYSDLPMAWTRVFELVDKKKLELRPTFCIEHYVSDGDATPEAELITEILVPTREVKRA